MRTRPGAGSSAGRRGGRTEAAWDAQPLKQRRLDFLPEDPATLWSDVLARKGGQYSLIARMPADPSLN